MVYLDDLLVVSADIELHYNDVHKTLDWLCESKLKSKGSKCEFAVAKVKYLGHIVEKGTVAMDPEKVCAVVDWPVPLLVRQLSSFLGLATY